MKSMKKRDMAINATATVSHELVQDLLASLGAVCSAQALDRCLKHAGIVKEIFACKGSRLTHDQLVRLYQESAGATGDEMMGLWSRPIRTGSLKYIVRGVLDAPAIDVALYRFTQIWNLLLDDYRLEAVHTDDALGVALVPRSANARVNRFGHALILKLTHGIVSWLVGHEVPVRRVVFVFQRPPFAADYSVLFPAQVGFCGEHSCIEFSAELAKIRPQRRKADVRAFLERAPRDWIFTSSQEHALRLKVRELLYSDLGRTLEDVSSRLYMSSRTLIRHLRDEQLSFQDIKDELRRDLAILHLIRNDVSLAEIAYAVGFSSPAVFHRAFRHWTGMTPDAYRAAQNDLH